jgi:membrane glycosyltransferase
MSEQSLDHALLAAPSVRLTLRRILFLTLVGLTMAAMIGLLSVALSAGGFGVVDAILVVLFAVTLPWMVIGFWNATIGFLIMRLARDPVATVTPTAAHITGKEPITASTAVLICIRKPRRIFTSTS